MTLSPAAKSWPALLALVGTALIASLGLAASFPLLDPDEGRNAEVAREMLATRDWSVPQLAGMPYLDKPPAFFWAQSLTIAAFGHTPLAARLPSALAAAGTLLLLGMLAPRAGGRRRTLLAVLLLALAPLFAALSAYVIFDMTLAMCVTAVWTLLVRECVDGIGLRRRLVMFAALTLGVLTKGPVMLAWALGGSAGAALLSRSRAPLRWLAWWPGWMLVLAVAGGWFALASARYPEYPHYAFLEESLERISTGSFHREQGWWFGLAVLVGGALPWSLVTPWWRLRPGLDSRVALGFVLFAAVFFTLSRSQLVTYLLPAIPALAWCAAETWDRPGASSRGGWILVGVTVGVAAVVIPIAGPRLHRYAESQSGALLARAIAARGGGAPVRYESCYSPGTDYLLGRSSVLVSPVGHETTSNYQLRYRATLMRRGQWRALDAAPIGDRDWVVVRPAGRASPSGKAGWTEIFRDPRFVAFRAPRAGP